MALFDTREVSALAVRLGEAGAEAIVASGEIVHDGAELIADTARTYVPVRTGATRDSIGVDRPDELTAEIGPATPYAPFIEYGTARQGPRPFMGPALDRHEGAIVAAFEAVADGTISPTRTSLNFQPE